MKEYNRVTKKYEEKEKTGKLKKPQKCKGGKEHDFVLLVPKWINRDHDLSKDEIEEYYQIEETRGNVEDSFNQKLRLIGIIYQRYNSVLRRFYRCSVCFKEKYE